MGDIIGISRITECFILLLITDPGVYTAAVNTYLIRSFSLARTPLLYLANRLVNICLHIPVMRDCISEWIHIEYMYTSLSTQNLFTFNRRFNFTKPWLKAIALFIELRTDMVHTLYTYIAWEVLAWMNNKAQLRCWSKYVVHIFGWWLSAIRIWTLWIKNNIHWHLLRHGVISWEVHPRTY